MNYQRNAVLVVSFSLFLPFCSLASAEAETAVVPYVEAGYLHYTLKFSGDVPLPDGTFVPGNNKFTFDMPIIKAGLAASWGDFSGNIYYRASGHSNDIQDFPAAPDFPTVKWEGERSDYGISAGYHITDEIMVFGGYRDAEMEGSGSFDSNYKFKNDGFFGGASYRLALTDTGGLTFSLAYVWLDMDLDENLGDFILPEINGDGDGAKGGVVWRDFFNQHWGYSVSADYYQYNFDLNTPNVQNQDNAEIDETETVFAIGLFYVF